MAINKKERVIFEMAIRVQLSTQLEWLQIIWSKLKPHLSTVQSIILPCSILILEEQIVPDQLALLNYFGREIMILAGINSFLCLFDKIRAGKKDRRIYIRYLIKPNFVRMEVTEAGFLNWPSNKKMLCKLAKEVKKDYVKDGTRDSDKEVIFAACGRIWEENNIKRGMDTLRTAINKLQPERSKEDIKKELRDLQERGRLSEWKDSDRVDFNSYNLEYSSEAEVQPQPGKPQSKGKGGREISQILNSSF